MQRQVAESDGKGGVRFVYVDCGPRAAVPGHGKTMHSPYGIGGGAMQSRGSAVTAEKSQ